MIIENEIQKLSKLLERNDIDEKVKQSVKKRLDILKNNKTVKK